MFNRKKKHWYNNSNSSSNKPNYKRSNEQDPQNKNTVQAADNTGQKKETEAVKVNAQNIPREETQLRSAAPAQVQKSPAAAAQKENAAPAAQAETGNGPEAPKTIVTDVECPICKMPIRNHYTAVRHKESGNLVHFDCVLRELSKENSSKLGKFRRIYYIGAGNFAIVKEFFDKRGHLKNYEIIEKINYESKD